MKMAFKIDRETSCEKLIMIVVSLILEIKKENCFLRVAFSKTSKSQGQRYGYCGYKILVYTDRAVLILDVGVEYWNLEIFNENLNVTLVK